MNLDIERSRKIDFFRKFDYVLMGTVLIICSIGLIFLNSAMYYAYKDHGAVAMKIQVIGLVLGIIFALIICAMDYSFFRNISFAFYIFNLGLMLLVFVPRIGIESGGSISWINLGITTYQPSELMKLAVIIVTAKYLEVIQEEGYRIEYVIVILGNLMLPLGLVMLQKDFGTALVFCFIFIVMLVAGKVSWKYIFRLCLIGGAALPFIWKFYFNGVKRARFLAFLDPEKYADSYAMQLVRALQAIGSGGLTGQGIGKGAMNSSGRIPVRLSDMIFAVVCEEGGFIAGMLIVLLMTILLAKMLHVAIKSRDVFGTCIAAGIFAMFFFTIFENLGMNVGIMPITGLPLPFVSKGGSAMITNFIAIGFILSISMRKRKGTFFS